MDTTTITQFLIEYKTWIIIIAAILCYYLGINSIGKVGGLSTMAGIECYKKRLALKQDLNRIPDSRVGLPSGIEWNDDGSEDSYKRIGLYGAILMRIFISSPFFLLLSGFFIAQLI